MVDAVTIENDCVEGSQADARRARKTLPTIGKAELRSFPAMEPGAERRPKPGDGAAALRDSQIKRLFWAMAFEIADQGFTATRVATVCERAHVATRTFYEHFQSKEHLFVALHEATSNYFIGYVEESISRFTAWPDRLIALSRAPVEAVVTNPTFFEGIMIGSMTSGTEVLGLRRRHHLRIAVLIQREVESARASDEELSQSSKPLKRRLALAISEGGEAMARLSSAQDLESVKDQLAADQLTLLISSAFPRVRFDELAPSNTRLGLDSLIAITRADFLVED